MKVLAVLVMSLAAFETASAYVVTAYTGKNCTGQNKRINVWDNTCANPDFPKTNSIRVEKFSGMKHQRARFYAGRSCVSGVVAGPRYADVTNHSWKKGACINFNSPVGAYGSSAFAGGRIRRSDQDAEWGCDGEWEDGTEEE